MSRRVRCCGIWGSFLVITLSIVTTALYTARKAPLELNDGKPRSLRGCALSCISRHEAVRMPRECTRNIDGIRGAKRVCFCLRNDELAHEPSPPGAGPDRC